jgi:hypothetical protein
MIFAIHIGTQMNTDKARISISPSLNPSRKGREV